ncbi:MAG: hypothetical protein GSR83_03865 [Desulfurococcales archaeon]|nr:hypothetical protein [Desulfurococcales archaeon]
MPYRGVTVFAEDTYGVLFHRKLIAGLENKKIIPRGKVRVKRLPSWTCNHSLRKKLAARVGAGEYKALIVVDSDNDPEKARENILRHLENWPVPFSIVTVDPRHETWLCIGMGLDPRKCRRNPEAVIERHLNTVYEKRMLSTLSSKTSIDHLMNKNDFKKYIKELKRLLNDP